MWPCVEEFVQPSSGPASCGEECDRHNPVEPVMVTGDGNDDERDREVQGSNKTPTTRRDLPDRPSNKRGPGHVNRRHGLELPSHASPKDTVETLPISKASVDHLCLVGKSGRGDRDELNDQADSGDNRQGVTPNWVGLAMTRKEP